MSNENNITAPMWQCDTASDLLAVICNYIEKGKLSCEFSFSSYICGIENLKNIFC